jgi:hypothetical protein
MGSNQADKENDIPIELSRSGLKEEFSDNEKA